MQSNTEYIPIASKINTNYNHSNNNKNKSSFHETIITNHASTKASTDNEDTNEELYMNVSRLASLLNVNKGINSNFYARAENVLKKKKQEKLNGKIMAPNRSLKMPWLTMDKASDSNKRLAVFGRSEEHKINSISDDVKDNIDLNLASNQVIISPRTFKKTNQSHCDHNQPKDQSEASNYSRAGIMKVTINHSASYDNSTDQYQTYIDPLIHSKLSQRSGSRMDSRSKAEIESKNIDAAVNKSVKLATSGKCSQPEKPPSTQIPSFRRPSTAPLGNAKPVSFTEGKGNETDETKVPTESATKNNFNATSTGKNQSAVGARRMSFSSRGILLDSSSRRPSSASIPQSILNDSLKSMFVESKLLSEPPSDRDKSLDLQDEAAGSVSNVIGINGRVILSHKIHLNSQSNKESPDHVDQSSEQPRNHAADKVVSAAGSPDDDEDIESCSIHFVTGDKLPINKDANSVRESKDIVSIENDPKIQPISQSVVDGKRRMPNVLNTTPLNPLYQLDPDYSSEGMSQPSSNRIGSPNPKKVSAPIAVVEDLKCAGWQGIALVSSKTFDSFQKEQYSRMIAEEEELHRDTGQNVGSLPYVIMAEEKEALNLGAHNVAVTSANHVAHGGYGALDQSQHNQIKVLDGGYVNPSTPVGVRENHRVLGGGYRCRPSSSEAENRPGSATAINSHTILGLRRRFDPHHDENKDVHKDEEPSERVFYDHNTAKYYSDYGLVDNSQSIGEQRYSSKKYIPLPSLTTVGSVSSADSHDGSATRQPAEPNQKHHDGGGRSWLFRNMSAINDSIDLSTDTLDDVQNALKPTESISQKVEFTLRDPQQKESVLTALSLDELVNLPNDFQQDQDDGGNDEAAEHNRFLPRAPTRLLSPREDGFYRNNGQRRIQHPAQVGSRPHSAINSRSTHHSQFHSSHHTRAQTAKIRKVGNDSNRTEDVGEYGKRAATAGAAMVNMDGDIMGVDGKDLMLDAFLNRRERKYKLLSKQDKIDVSIFAKPKGDLEAQNVADSITEAFGPYNETIGAVGGAIPISKKDIELTLRALQSKNHVRKEKHYSEDNNSNNTIPNIYQLNDDNVFNNNIVTIKDTDINKIQHQIELYKQLQFIQESAGSDGLEDPLDPSPQVLFSEEEKQQLISQYCSDIKPPIHHISRRAAGIHRNYNELTVNNKSNTDNTSIEDNKQNDIPLEFSWKSFIGKTATQENNSNELNLPNNPSILENLRKFESPNVANFELTNASEINNIKQSVCETEPVAPTSEQQKTVITNPNAIDNGFHQNDVTKLKKSTEVPPSVSIETCSNDGFIPETAGSIALSLGSVHATESPVVKPVPPKLKTNERPKSSQRTAKQANKKHRNDKKQLHTASQAIASYNRSHRAIKNAVVKATTVADGINDNNNDSSIINQQSSVKKQDNISGEEMRLLISGENTTTTTTNNNNNNIAIPQRCRTSHQSQDRTSSSNNVMLTIPHANQKYLPNQPVQINTNNYKYASVELNNNDLLDNSRHQNRVKSADSSFSRRLAECDPSKHDWPVEIATSFLAIGEKQSQYDEDYDHPNKWTLVKTNNTTIENNNNKIPLLIKEYDNIDHSNLQHNNNSNNNNNAIEIDGLQIESSRAKISPRETGKEILRKNDYNIIKINERIKEQKFNKKILSKKLEFKAPIIAPLVPPHDGSSIITTKDNNNSLILDNLSVSIIGQYIE